MNIPIPDMNQHIFDKINIMNSVHDHNTINHIYEGNNFSPTINDNEPLLNEIKYFLTCAKKNKKPLTDLSFGQKIVEILERV